MNLTVLGSAASYPGPGRACAGHLIRTSGTHVLFDCGSGVVSNLGRVMDPALLDAVFITHAHVDHFGDLYALQAALRYAPDGPRPPLPLYAPAGLLERMGALLSPSGALDLAAAFAPITLADGEPVVAGGLTVTPRTVDHIDPTFALVAEADGARLCYTSDTGVGPAVESAAAGADVLLAEATLPPAYENRARHLTASQAGALATASGARTLVLTHLWPTVDRVKAAEDARASFGGRVIVADELDVIPI